MIQICLLCCVVCGLMPAQWGQCLALGSAQYCRNNTQAYWHCMPPYFLNESSAFPLPWWGSSLVTLPALIQCLLLVFVCSVIYSSLFPSPPPLTRCQRPSIKDAPSSSSLKGIRGRHPLASVVTATEAPETPLQTPSKVLPL